MARLPVIVSFGGFNAAGRSSFHQSYQRIILDHLNEEKRRETLAGLAQMMGYVNPVANRYEHQQGEPLSAATAVKSYREQIEANSLIRSISSDLLRSDKPNRMVDVAAQLPTGFDPKRLYPARFHPRGLQLAIIGASDAINALGLDWQSLTNRLPPHKIGCYASSIGGQLDQNGFGGLLQSHLLGERVTSKQLPFGFNSMTADFVNAYVLGNVGMTSAITGACASFLYNLRAAVTDIQAGNCRLAIVGSSEAAITPEIIAGFNAMGALATQAKLNHLDGVQTSDLRRASRPFGENCGFVVGEGSQFVVLMDDDLALDTGADIHGAISDVFIHADGFKKSISSPGIGNYITVARAVASAKSLLGDQAIQRRSFVQAHGSSTPQNRVTESRLLNRVAEVFGIRAWPIAAIKAYIGHTLGSASGDQLINALGVFATGILPGITTIKSVAEDVEHSRLSIATTHRELEQRMDIAFINSKGFGGNNATASVLAPHLVHKMLKRRHGDQAMSHYHRQRDQVRQQAQDYHQGFLCGDYKTIYHYGQTVLDEQALTLEPNKLQVAGLEHPIDLSEENLYKDMLDLTSEA